MEYRQLGNSGVKISVIGLGTNRFGSEALPQKEVDKIIDLSLDLGINHIDTSSAYAGGKSEETIGNAIKGRRDRFVIASKFYFPVGDGPNDRGISRYHMMNALETSLRRLQTDHVDLYYIHRWEDTTPIEETLRGLDDVLSAGKIRYVGVSDFASWQLAKANLLSEFRGWTPIVVIQSQYNLLDRDMEREILPYCRANNVGFVPYFPLAGGFLTGKYKRGEPAPAGSRGEGNAYIQEFMNDATYNTIEALTTWATERDRSLNELAHAWLMAQPTICSVISGATKPDHVKINAKAADWALTTKEVDEVNAILNG